MTLQSRRRSTTPSRLRLSLVHRFTIGVLLLGGAFASGAHAQNDANADAAEVDPVALAAVLLDGGDADRALSVLKQSEATASKAQPARYWLLRGIAAQKLGRDEDAFQALRRSARLTPKDRRVQLLLAKAAWQTGRAQATLAALDAAGAQNDQAAIVALRADALLKLGNAAAAADVLDAGYRRTREPALLAREVELFASLGLFRAAGEAARPLLDGDKDMALAVVERLRQAGGRAQAVELAERLRLRHPADVDATLLLAQALTDAGRPANAALLYDELMAIDPAYATDAAELYRRLGRLDAALWRNGLAPSSDRKWRQRFGLLVEQERVDEAAAMAPRLQRLGLLKDATVAYALGWALFQTGDQREAEKVLKTIHDPGVFNDATALRQRIAACRAAVAAVAAGSGRAAQGCP